MSGSLAKSTPPLAYNIAGPSQPPTVPATAGEWQAGTVTALHAGELEINGGTLQIVSSPTLHGTMLIDGLNTGLLDVTGSVNVTGTLTAFPVGSGLTINAGTLVASGLASGAIIAQGTTASSPAVFPFTVLRNVPLASSFTLVNTNSATISDNTNGPLVWQCNHAGIGSNTLTIAQKATPNAATTDFTYTVHAIFNGSSSTTQALPCIGFSDGTKYDLVLIAGGSAALFTQTWNTVTSNASSTQVNLFATVRDLWFKVIWLHATTTRTLQISTDGFTFYTINTTNAPFLTPSQFVIGANISSNSSTVPVTISIDYLVQT